MTTTFSNAPAPDELLLIARESLKALLREPDVDHAYAIRMAMNAMGIAARAMQCETAPPAHPEMGDGDFRRWVRQADEAAIADTMLIANLHRHVSGKLRVSNPRFRPEAFGEET